jgi:hypothetical protein
MPVIPYAPDWTPLSPSRLVRPRSSRPADASTEPTTPTPPSGHALLDLAFDATGSEFAINGFVVG